ncbi:MAG: HAD family hydrolase [Candidatus Bathyarchaeia archaeon]
MPSQGLKVKALLIDLDGTLVDATEALVEAAKHALTTIGFHHTDPQIGVEIARQLQSNLPLDDLLQRSGIADTEKQQFVSAYLNAFHNLTLEKTKPLPNVHTTLHTLSKHLPLALVTRRNIPQERLTKELRRLQFIQYFKVMVTSQDVTQPQPSPEILLKAAQKLRAPIEACAFVTDSIVDIQAGKAAGVKTVAVLTGLFSRNELERWKPDLILKNITCLPDLLRGFSEKD